MLVEVMKINQEDVTVVTSLDVAETFEKEHKHVLEDIRRISESISTADFSALFYEDEYKASNGKKNPMYHMNRDGFTLLVMGYNGEKAMRFKLGYIRQFNAMEKLIKENLEERHRTEMERAKGIAVRQVLTNSLKVSRENERMHGFAYSTYTDMIYRIIFNKNAKQLREEYGISKKDNLRDCFTAEELKLVQSKEMLVSGLVDCGWGYDEIKDFVINKSNKLIEVS